MDTYSEHWRRITEARHYIRQGYVDEPSVDRLCARLMESRSRKAVQMLRQDMREQYITKQRGEWV